MKTVRQKKQKRVFYFSRSPTCLTAHRSWKMLGGSRGFADRLTARAFTMLEMIGVMAVLLILALALSPILIKQIDRMAGDKEYGQLKAFADAFRQGVVKTKTIPNETGWDSMIATNLGVQIDQVRVNERSVPRVFLIDPAFQVGSTTGLHPPFAQDLNGSGNPPVSPRLMMVSSISVYLPVSLVSGLGLSSGPYAFNNIWDSSEGTVPAGWTWTGKGDDLKIQRLNLSDLFYSLYLNNQDVLNSASYAIDGAPVPTLSPGAVGGAVFLDSTVVSLYGTNGAVQFLEALHQSRYFVFDETWRGGGFVGPTIHHPDGVDLQLAANIFLNNCRDNPNCTTFSPPPSVRQQVINAMIAYMSDYVLWRDSYSPTNYSSSSTWLTALDGAQTTLAGGSKGAAGKGATGCLTTK